MKICRFPAYTALSDYPSLLPPCVSFTHSVRDPFFAGKLIRPSSAGPLCDR